MKQRDALSGEELFVVDNSEENCYLYAPLRRVIVSMNRDALGSVSRFIHSGDFETGSADAAVIRQLKDAGLFSEPIPEPPVTPSDYLFRPHEVTLFPTTQCNLRCIFPSEPLMARLVTKQVPALWQH